MTTIILWICLGLLILSLLVAIGLLVYMLKPEPKNKNQIALSNMKRAVEKLSRSLPKK